MAEQLMVGDLEEGDPPPLAMLDAAVCDGPNLVVPYAAIRLQIGLSPKLLEIAERALDAAAEGIVVPTVGNSIA